MFILFFVAAVAATANANAVCCSLFGSSSFNSYNYFIEQCKRNDEQCVDLAVRFVVCIENEQNYLIIINVA